MMLAAAAAAACDCVCSKGLHECIPDMHQERSVVVSIYIYTQFVDFVC